jgi:hypothetical protein
MTSTNNSLQGSGPRSDRHNQRRVTLWSLVWALSYTGAALGIKKAGWPVAATVAAVIVTALLGIATLLAYHRFLQGADELRRKIELEALALAFGVGAVGGLTYWLLVASGAAPALDFIYVFVLMIVTHPVGVVIGCRRYS